jgi:UDPglucose 6-dehydrogenase
MGRLSKQDLLRGNARIAIWGSGFIGATTAMAFASEGVHVTCYDINENAVKMINAGQLAIANLELWFGATMDEFVEKGLVQATSRWQDLDDPAFVAHFVAIPTERDGKPWDGALLDVLAKLRHISPPLVIIESTLIPGQLDTLELGKLRVGVAPRRDWFHSPDKNLRNLARVFAGLDAETTEDMREVLSIVCDNLLGASSHVVAELVKSVENSLLHIPAVYATQLAHAYPHVNVGEVLALAATHWRIGRYYPSLGTGGYCIPISSQYVQMGAREPQHLTIIDAAVRSDTAEPRFIAERISRLVQGDVGVLGIAYKGDLKVHALSPALPIIEYLRQQPRLTPFVNDPYYSDQEIRIITQVEPFALSEPLSRFKALILVSDHKVYGRVPLHRLLDELEPGTIVIDNYGVWKKYDQALRQHGVRYFKIGDAGWTLDEEPARLEQTEQLVPAR